MFFTMKSPRRSHLMLGAEFAQEPRQLKEIPGVVIPTTLGYVARWRASGESPLTLEVGLMQLGGNIGSGFDMEARHQVILGVGYRF